MLARSLTITASVGRPRKSERRSNFVFYSLLCSLAPCFGRSGGGDCDCNEEETLSEWLSSVFPSAFQRRGMPAARSSIAHLHAKAQCRPLLPGPKSRTLTSYRGRRADWPRVGPVPKPGNSGAFPHLLIRLSLRFLILDNRPIHSLPFHIR